MIALIFDDSGNIIGNIPVTNKTAFGKFLDQLPANWYGELREGHDGSWHNTFVGGNYTQVECSQCHDMIIDERMSEHVRRKHESVQGGR